MKRFLSLMTVALLGSCGAMMAQDVVVADSTAVTEDVVPTEVQAEENVEQSVPLVAEMDDQESAVVNLGVRDDDFGVGIAKTWEYQLNLVFNNSFDPNEEKDGDASGGFELTGGYNFSKHWFLGASTGYLHDFGGVMGVRAGSCVPWLLAAQCRWNLTKRFTFYVMGRWGAVCNIADNIDVVYFVSGEEKITNFKYPNYMYCECQPGIMIRPTKNLDVRLSLCYAYAKPGTETEGLEYNTYEEHLMSIKVGIARRFNFGK